MSTASARHAPRRAGPCGRLALGLLLRSALSFPLSRPLLHHPRLHSVEPAGLVAQREAHSTRSAPSPVRTRSFEPVPPHSTKSHRARNPLSSTAAPSRTSKMHVWTRVKHELTGRRLLWNLLCALRSSSPPSLSLLLRHAPLADLASTPCPAQLLRRPPPHLCLRVDQAGARRTARRAQLAPVQRLDLARRRPLPRRGWPPHRPPRCATPLSSVHSSSYSAGARNPCSPPQLHPHRPSAHRLGRPAGREPVVPPPVRLLAPLLDHRTHYGALSVRVRAFLASSRSLT